MLDTGHMPTRYDERLGNVGYTAGVTLAGLYTVRWFSPWWSGADRAGGPATLAMWSFAVLVLSQSVRRGWRRSPRLLLWGVIAAVGMIAASMLAENFLSPALQSLFNVSAEQNSNTADFEEKLHNNPWLWGTLASLIGPATEEVLYRGALFGWISRWSVPVAHVTTAGLFALFHVVDAWADGHPEQLTLTGSYVLSSLVLTAVYRRNRNLLPCIVGHGFANGLGIWMMLRS